MYRTRTSSRTKPGDGPRSSHQHRIPPRRPHAHRGARWPDQDSSSPARHNPMRSCSCSSPTWDSRECSRGSWISCSIPTLRVTGSTTCFTPPARRTATACRASPRMRRRLARWPAARPCCIRSPDAASEHHGGALNFGNDGKLYFTTGEHFTPASAQSLTNPRGKIHRINKDGTVPTDNPFYDGAGPNVDSIWAHGLRNPFRAHYDAPTGRFLHRRCRR